MQNNAPKTPVLLVGAGAFCKTVIDFLSNTPWTPIGVVENDRRIKDVCGVPVLGDESRLRDLKAECEIAVITVDYHASQRLRKYLFQTLQKLGFETPAITAPTARVSKDATAGAACLILPDAVVGPGCKIGENCVLDTGALVKTDAWIGDNAFVGARALVGEGAIVERGARLGDGSLVAPKVVVGRRAWLDVGVAARKNVHAYKIVRSDS